MARRAPSGVRDPAREIRQRRGLTQEELGKAGGVTRRLIASYERDDAQSGEPFDRARWLGNRRQREVIVA